MSTTISIPLSLLEIAHYLTIFIIFIFFYNFQTQDDISPEDLGYSIIFVGVILSLQFVVYLLFPDLALNLNGINVFTANYGHSHFSAYLLLLIPLSWWFLQTDKLSFFNYKKALLILFYVLLIITFGRVAIFFSVLQLGTMYLLSKDKHSQKKLVFGISFLLFFAILIFLISSLFFTTSECYSPVYRLQLCKSFFSELRPTYYKRAFLAISDKPLFGFGPGTYEMISSKYVESHSHNSNFVHNAFLQVFAETGLIAGVLFLLLFTLFLIQSISVLKRSYQSKMNVLAAFALGFTTLFFNSFFDFDWDLFPILNLSIVFAALTFWGSKKQKNHSFNYTVIGKILWLSIAIMIIVSSVMIGFSKVFIKMNEYNFAFDLSKYYYPHYSYFLRDGALSLERKNQFYSIYSNHLFIIQSKLDDSESLKEKKKLYEEMIYFSAWNKTNVEYLEVLYELKEYKELVLTTQDALFLLRNERGNMGMAYHDLESKVIEYQYLGIQGLLKENDVESSIAYFEKLLPIFYDFDSEIEYHHIYTDLIASDFDWKEKILTYLEFLSQSEVETFTEVINTVLMQYHQSNASQYSYAPYLNEEISLLAMQAGDRMYDAEEYLLAAKLYTLGVKYDAWVLNVYKPLFLEEKMGEVPSDFLLHFQLERDSYVYYDEVVATQYFIASVRERSLGNIDNAEKLFRIGKEIAPWISEEYEN